MARQAQQQASQNVTTGQNFANEANTNAQGAQNWLTPTLENQYANPQGFGQGWLDSSKAEAGQIAGSKAAGAKNQLDLTAERTGNSAGFAPAEDQAMRDSQSALSNSLLGIDTANAEAKVGQQSQALSGMGQNFGQNLNAETGNLNASTGGVNAETNAGNNGWFQNTLAAITALKPKVV
jgi:hypothetical protein